MKKNWWIAIIVVLVLAVLVFVFTKRPGPNKAEVVLHDILSLQQMQISSFDPLDAYHAGHIQMVKQLYNTLVDIDFDGNPVPSLAEKWESSDGKTWHFVLRKNVYFIADSCFPNKSERAFTATDVKYTFERLLQKDSKSLGVSYFANLTGLDKYRNGEASDIDGIKVIDDHTVDFILKEKDLSFPALLTLSYVSIVPRKAVEHYKEHFAQHPVGTGPFRLQTYEPNKEITLVKNVDYWEKQAGSQLPYIGKVVVHLTTDDNLSLLMLKNKTSDFLELNLPLFKQLLTMGLPFTYKTETKANPQLNFYLFNLDRIKDVETRKSISYAINREVLQAVLDKEGSIATSLFPPAIFKDLVSTKDLLKYQPDKAAAGLRSSRTLKLVCFEDLLSKSIAELIASSLKKYKITMKIESVPFPVLVDRLTKGNYDLIQIYWGPLYADAGHYLNPFLTASFPPSGNNFNKYSNPEFDKLVTEARTLPVTERRTNFLKAEDIILGDMPFLLLYFKNTIRVSNEKFDLPLHPLQYRFYKYAKVK
jgi:ABC-type transport system substrate-binding protein